MTEFGVCNYDLDGYEPKVENLEIYDSYETAFGQYMKKVIEDPHYPFTWDKTLWYVWVENDMITQFEQLDKKTKCRLVNI